MAVKEIVKKPDVDEKVIEMEIERLRFFQYHPFKVQADSQMIELQDSIRNYGILTPLIVRPRMEGTYEIISGHRRKYAFYGRENMNPQMKNQLPNGNTVTIPDGVDPELLAKILTNPDTVALLSILAKTMNIN